MAASIKHFYTVYHFLSFFHLPYIFPTHVLFFLWHEDARLAGVCLPEVRGPSLVSIQWPTDTLICENQLRSLLVCSYYILICYCNLRSRVSYIHCIISSSKHYCPCRESFISLLFLQQRDG